MRADESDTPFAITYLVVLAAQVPLWLSGGMIWAGFMIALAGSDPFNALIGGLVWGFVMWLVCGNLFAAGLTWRRSAELPAPERVAFRGALDQACRRLRLKVLAESPDEIVLGPRRALVRFRLQEVRVAFADATATVTGPALTFRAVRRALTRALAAPADAGLGS